MRAKSAMVRKAAINSEMEHQNQKNKILEQDRKLFLRQAEEIKEKYREQIDKLKNQNMKLRSMRDQFISNKKNKTVFSKTAFEAGFDNKSGFSNTDENFLRIILDKEKHQTKIKKNLLYTLQDKLQQAEANKLSYIEENPMMRTIRILENRLDKIMIKYNEAQSIRQTYEEVAKRLNEERVGYDSQLAAIQTCLKGKQHDFQELLLLAHDATHAKEAAFAELKRFEQRRITVQEMRTKYVSDKKEQVNKDVPRMNESTLRGQNYGDRSGNKNTIFGNTYKHDQSYQKQELNDYQQAFRKLKEVTGVMDANEIIQKFKTQGLTTQSLQELQLNYNIKIDNLKSQKQSLRKRFQNIKYVINQQNGERRRLDEIESQYAKITNQYERTSLKYNKLSNEMINITAGIEHLKEKTSFYKIDAQSTNGSLQQDLSIFNKKIRMIYDVIKSDPNYMKYSFSANAAAIQNMMNVEPSYKNYNKNRSNSIDDEEES